MGGRHQKRPHEETGRAPPACRSARDDDGRSASGKAPSRSRVSAGADAQRSIRPQTNPPTERRAQRPQPNRMPQRDRHEREPDDAAILPVQAERHGKQPAHRRVEAVKGAEAGEREPWPELEGSRRANHRLLLTDSSRNPTSSRRLRAAPGAAGAASASRRRTSRRRRCRPPARRRASPSSPRCPSG